MAIELDSEVADRICAACISEHIDMQKANIKALKKIRKRLPHQEQDLQDDIVLLDALQRVSRYFGG
jgi:hypothetical protein